MPLDHHVVYIYISKTNQDNPNIQNAFEAKHHQLHFCLTKPTDFGFLISENDFINFFSVSKEHELS